MALKNISAYLSTYALCHAHPLLTLSWVFIDSVFRPTVPVVTDLTVYFKYFSHCRKLSFW